MGKNYTWDDFLRKMEKERQQGNPNCPEASLIALELLQPRLSRLFANCNMAFKTSMDLDDIYQDAYLIISRQIENYDAMAASFATFIDKWLLGIVRDNCSGGISEYAVKKGTRIYSLDGGCPSHRDCRQSESTQDLDNLLERIADPNAAIEDIMEKREEENSRIFLKNLLKNRAGNLKEKNRSETYVNAVFFSKLFGGYQNLSEEMRLEVENQLEEVAF